MKDNIILIGFMGSGKSSVGRGVSQKLTCEFCDTDVLIEEEAGESVQEIFGTKGEEAFRELETKVLKKIQTNRKKIVLSTGGGVPLREENRTILKKLGIVIYLNACEDEIYNRLQEDGTRPLLQGEDPKAKISNLMKKREALYQSAADFVVATDGLSVEEVIQKVMFILEEMT